MALPAIPFLYLRHGETDWNAEGRAQGSSDIPLNATGRAQAADAAAALAGVSLDAIVASPLGRADETARIVARALGLDVVTEPLLREVSFGVREGDVLGQWYDDWLTGASTPEGAESFVDLTVRATHALTAHLAPGKRVMFVAHGALFRAIRALMGLPIDQRLANGVPLECTAVDGAWRVLPVLTQQQGV